MKKISEHLGEIIVAIACAVIIIGGVVAFRGPISDFFGDIVNKGFGASGDTSEPDPDAHVHVYGDWVELDHQYHMQKCDCGDTIGEEHTWKYEPIEEGAPVHLVSCAVCDYVYGGEDHDFDEDDICVRCGAHKPEEPEEPGENPEEHVHYFGDTICINNEFHARVCSCGFTEAERHALYQGTVVNNYGVCPTLCYYCDLLGKHTYEDDDGDVYCDFCGYYNFADCKSDFPGGNNDQDGDGYCDRCGNTVNHEICGIVVPEETN